MIIKSFKELEKLDEANCQNVIELSIRGIPWNYNKQIPLKVFKCVNLQVLDLSNERIKFFSPDFSKLIKLEKLDLSSNDLEKLPQEIIHLTNLKILNLSENNFESIPNQVFHLKNLNELNLSKNNIKSILSDIGNLQTLESLDLSSNLIEFLPATFKNLKFLRKLNLSHNVKLDFLMASNIIPELNRLESLSLVSMSLTANYHFFYSQAPGKLVLEQPARSSKEINYLLNGVFKLSNLKHFDLEKNNLETIPIEIGNLTGIEELILSINDIKFLPQTMSRLKNLSTIDLVANNELDWQSAILVFKELENLKKVTITSKQFENYKCLVNVFLSLRNKEVPISINRSEGLYPELISVAGTLTLTSNNINYYYFNTKGTGIEIECEESNLKFLYNDDLNESNYSVRKLSLLTVTTPKEWQTEEPESLIIPKNALSKFKNLKELVLNNIDPDNPDSQIFLSKIQNLQSLENIFVERTYYQNYINSKTYNLTNLFLNVFKNKNLKHLFIQDGIVDRNISIEVAKANKLELLHLKNITLSGQLDFVNELKNLKHLIIINNYDQLLFSDKIHNLKKLETLAICGNPLTIKLLPNLKRVFLRHYLKTELSIIRKIIDACVEKKIEFLSLVENGPSSDRYRNDLFRYKAIPKSRPKIVANNLTNVTNFFSAIYENDFETINYLLEQKPDLILSNDIYLKKATHIRSDPKIESYLIEKRNKYIQLT